MSLRIAFKTLGCKLNFSETATLEHRLAQAGYQCVPFDGEAEVYVVNTCAVTEQAGRKCRYYVHRVRQRCPQAKVVLMGCYSALKAEALQAELGADMVLGSNTKFLLPDKLPLLFRDTAYVFDRGAEDAPVFFGAYSLQEERTRSFLKVQDGCDYFCTYCTVPLARGRIRSGEMFRLLADASEVVAHGIKEIVLSGVNIGEYRGSKGERLADLLSALSEVEGLRRLRISSIEPNLLTDEIIAMAAERPNIMPHFHIPLQSGCDRILALMGRRYRTDLYAEKVRNIKARMPYAFVAADVIAGFPGETEADFEACYRFIESLPLSALHVFPYSPRPNTPAAEMEGQVSKAVKAERVSRLMALSDAKKAALYRACEGRTAQVLVESKECDGHYSGFTENYLRVKLLCDEKSINTIQAVRLGPLGADGLAIGEVINA
ncbi:MAG: tRNA (N(6)-L-threonylcarbamoyladenosine(37)-C(2))-methylthiotransferase MtaB [Bacteroidales bacterium]|nr:tRNA (N(6)-L-threonylcarbamoyladenosine(37)-C(2))-methylthiotransferase MtaB [Bacteroidales bacterium]